jgi:hypothetical protein
VAKLVRSPWANGMLRKAKVVVSVRMLVSSWVEISCCLLGERRVDH